MRTTFTKYNVSLSAALLMTATVGCGDKPAVKPANNSTTTTTNTNTTPDAVKSSTEKSTTSTTTTTTDTDIVDRDSVATQKRREAAEATLEQGKDTLARIDARMGELSTQIKTSTGEAKIKLQQEWDQLEPQREQLNRQLQDFGNASSKAFDDVKAGTRNAFDDLRKSVNEARSRFDERNQSPSER